MHGALETLDTLFFLRCLYQGTSAVDGNCSGGGLDVSDLVDWPSHWSKRGEGILASHWSKHGEGILASHWSKRGEGMF